MSDCEAPHDSASSGHCHKVLGHAGVHAAFERWGAGYKFTWPNKAEADKPNVFLTSADLSILLTALNPIRQFFPELEKKLADAKAEAAK